MDTFMAVVVFLLIGLIAGWIASQMMTGHGLGTAGDVLVGIVGAVIGGFIFDVFHIRTYGFGGAIVTSVIGAIVLLFIVSLFPHRQGPTTTKPMGRA